MRKFIVVTIAIAALFLVAGCTEDKKAEQQRESAVHARADVFEQAESLVPAPVGQNFPLRRALAKFTDRQDLLDHPWYIYILGDNGNVIGYYVGQTVPINACDFLSSTEDYQDGAILTAPSLDGIFYGGSGSASGCDAWFFFDSSTDALVQIRGVNFFTADQPLKLDAKPITVESK